jgi:hypothetical protein
VAPSYGRVGLLHLAVFWKLPRWGGRLATVGSDVKADRCREGVELGSRASGALGVCFG